MNNSDEDAPTGYWFPMLSFKATAVNADPSIILDISRSYATSAVVGSLWIHFRYTGTEVPTSANVQWITMAQNYSGYNIRPEHIAMQISDIGGGAIEVTLYGWIAVRWNSWLTQVRLQEGRTLGKWIEDMTLYTLSGSKNGLLELPEADATFYSTVSPHLTSGNLTHHKVPLASTYKAEELRRYWQTQRNEVTIAAVLQPKSGVVANGDIVGQMPVGYRVANYGYLGYVDFPITLSSPIIPALLRCHADGQLEVVADGITTQDTVHINVTYPVEP